MRLKHLNLINTKTNTDNITETQTDAWNTGGRITRRTLMIAVNKQR